MITMFWQKMLGGLGAALLLTAAAHAEDWRITQSSGQIWLQSEDPQTVALTVDSVVPGGSTIVTGKGGRVMLVRGGQSVMVGPNSVVTVPDGDSAGMTTILQQAGEATFDVDRRNVEHFSVETPFLAAVVKGTRFTVNVLEGRANVSVTRGLVGVTALSTGENVDVKPGQRASAGGTAGRLTISGSGAIAAIIQGSPRYPMVDQMSDAELRQMQLGYSVGGLRGDQEAAAGQLGPQAGRMVATNAAGVGSDFDGAAVSIGEIATSMAALRSREQGSNVPALLIPAGFVFCGLIGFGIAYLRNRR